MNIKYPVVFQFVTKYNAYNTICDPSSQPQLPKLSKEEDKLIVRQSLIIILLSAVHIHILYILKLLV